MPKILAGEESPSDPKTESEILKILKELGVEVHVPGDLEPGTEPIPVLAPN